eukprot:196377_1
MSHRFLLWGNNKEKLTEWMYETKTLCKNVDFVDDLRKHRVNKKGELLINGYIRNLYKQFPIKEVMNIICEYYLFIDNNKIRGIWKCEIFSESADIRGESDTKIDHYMTINKDLSFEMDLKFVLRDADSFMMTTIKQNMNLKGYILVLNEYTYLLFFDTESAKQLKKQKNVDYIVNPLKFEQEHREKVYTKRILQIYKKNKVKVVKKYKAEIEKLHNQTWCKKNKKKVLKKKKVNWDVIELKFKTISAAQILKSNDEKYSKIKTQKEADRYAAKKMHDVHEIYQKICKKYEEKELPVFLGPIYLRFDGLERQKCIMYYGKHKLLKQTLLKDVM